MPTLLCYGDSLTWGAVPGTGARHPKADRWPDALRDALDAQGLLPDMNVVADGLRGRTTAYAGNPSPADMNGAATLPNVLHAQAPVDAVAVMLGTNDIWSDINCDRVLRGLTRLVEIIRSHPFRMPDAPQPLVLLIAPPAMVACHGPSPTNAQIAQSEAMAGDIQGLAAELGTGFFDAGSVAQASPVDGVHMDADQTRALGQALVPATVALFSGAKA